MRTGTSKELTGGVPRNDELYLFNGHGDVVGVTDKSGNLEKSYEYDAFGNEVNPNSNDNNPFRYCGEYWDNETGSIYLRARYYSPGTGRFTTEDPIKDGSNWYSYCGGNPIAFCDPNGMEQIVVSGGDYSDNIMVSNYDYNFIDPAIKNLRALKEKNPNETLTWIIADCGWSKQDKAYFNEVSKDIGCNIVYIENSEELIKYINEKDDQKSRVNDKITVFNVFSHGIIDEDGRGTISLGYNYLPWYNKDLNLSADDITNKIYATAFDNPYCWFGSCNLGNNTTNSFAQTWVNKFGGEVYAFAGTSNYSYMDNDKTDEQYKNRNNSYGFFFEGSTYYPVPSEGASFNRFYRWDGRKINYVS